MPLACFQRAIAMVADTLAVGNKSPLSETQTEHVLTWRCWEVLDSLVRTLIRQPAACSTAAISELATPRPVLPKIWCGVDCVR